MTDIDLSIHYQDMPDVVFAKASGMKSYLLSEGETWASFLRTISEHSTFKTIPLDRGTAVGAHLSEIFQTLTNNISNPAAFNNITLRHKGNACAPPPAKSLIGQLILGLMVNDHLYPAQSVYLWFVHQNLKISLKQNNNLASYIRQGEALVTAAFASEALPYQSVSSQKIAGAAREAENHVASLLNEVKRSSKINSDYEGELSEVRESHVAHIEHLKTIFIENELSRTEEHSQWVQNVDDQVASRFEKGESRLAEVERANATTLAAQKDEYDRLRDLFFTQLRLRAPVALWESRATAHKLASKWAMIRFYCAIILAIGTGVLVPYFAGDHIAGSFVENVCSSIAPVDCERFFSAKGPLTITGLLLVMSLVLWITRLQYRVYLSERHLALNASEKQAFAETYMAMRQDESIAVDSEAIVLASLFRPSQDGIIRDDETSVDLSAAAIIAKQLGRGSN